MEVIIVDKKMIVFVEEYFDNRNNRVIFIMIVVGNILDILVYDYVND